MDKIEFSKEWCMKAAEQEGDSDVTAGKPSPLSESLKKLFSCVRCGQERPPAAILCTDCLKKEGYIK